MRNSRVILCSGINLDREYVNVLNYTEQQMLNLCLANKVAEVSDYSFIRQNKDSLRTSFTYSQVLNSNYIAFQNKDYDNKWFFAFIDDVIYRGDKCTEIVYTIDSWSTWFNKLTIKSCFVKRHHVNDDTIGLNTVPENLNVGEMVEEFEQQDIGLSEYFWVVVQTSWLPNDNSQLQTPPAGKQYSGITVYSRQIFGEELVLFDFSIISNGVKNLGLFINRTNSDGHIADIKNIFIVPSTVIDQTQLTLHTANAGTGQTDFDFNFYTTNWTSTSKEINFEIDKISSFTNLTIKNNKCFCYPYNYLFVSNNIGNQNIYRYEEFTTLKCNFTLYMAMSIGISGKLVPLNYKRMLEADDESIPLAKYPTCSWSADSFTNWLTQQAVNFPTQFTKRIMNTPANPADIGFSISYGVGDIIGSMYEESLKPNITGGQNTGDVNFSSLKNTIVFRGMRCKDEYMKIIDDYFTRFGYKIARVIVPNITGRTYWNYVEIGDSEEIGFGTVPMSHMETINKACRKGVTIWHSHDNIGNYNLDNSIVSQET